ncbi:ammonia-forming cytochrome c nitrite reductase subunit c552 [Halosquirtibacter laminarini]|uniref:Ammonia-forming cytochrome c nitrite reductase subunit c552 n=1 Tax=Halosquirtibacter laminarini TaxID=3374600 RepID=A0AC61NFQ9_9BACT|nr:ammonia-forming cytochrome c nitrite reductase subunit c552 [Prolixibacteraceae bacterium]
MSRNSIARYFILAPVFIGMILGAFVFFHGCKGVKKDQTKEDGYAGSESCKECHERFYKLWEPSHHGKAMQPITPEFISENLPKLKDWTPVEDGSFRIINQDGKLIFQEKKKDGVVTNYEAVHAMGGKNIYYFMTELERGKLQTLPLAYDINKNEWYNAQDSGMRHFGGDSGVQDEALPWKHYLYTFNTTCHDCHVSQMTKNYDLKTDSYHLTWKEAGINCEACHGPSKEHIRLCREAEAKGEEVTELGLISWRTFTHEQSDATCSACHAKMSPLTAKFIPGEKFYDHYNLVTLEDIDYYPDGRDLGENYTYTSWSQSPCVQAGADMDCVTCHTSSGRYRFQDKDFNNACMPCHKDKVENITAHTHHPAEGAAGKCVSCHMPKTDFARMKRSDHSMRPPMPRASMEFGSPNACNICHTDKSNEWADKAVRRWHKDDYQAETIMVGRWIREAREDDWKNFSKMERWIRKNPKKEIFINSLVRMMNGCDNPKKWDLFNYLFETNPSALVRSSAVTQMSYDRSNPKTKELLVKALDDSLRLVRRMATSALTSYPLDSFNASDREKVRENMVEYENSMVIRPDDWVAHYNLGNFYSQQGQHQKALDEYKISNKLFEDAVVPLVNGGYTSAVLGNYAEAETMLKKALTLEPDNEAANLNYALLLGEQGRTNEARKCYEKVLKANPESGVAAFNLAVIYGQNDLENAIKYSKIAFESGVQNPKYGYTYAFYLLQNGSKKSAIKVLKEVVKIDPNYLDAWVFLGQLYEQEKQYSNAIKACESALKIENLPARASQGLQQKIGALKRHK